MTANIDQRRKAADETELIWRGKMKRRERKMAKERRMKQTESGRKAFVTRKKVYVTST